MTQGFRGPFTDDLGHAVAAFAGWRRDGKRAQAFAFDYEDVLGRWGGSRGSGRARKQGGRANGAGEQRKSNPFHLDPFRGFAASL
jgi:hypothetical protein